VVGQSGTASPTFLLVTIPPLQISNSVATHVSHANRLSHFLDERTRDHTTEGLDPRAQRRFQKTVSGRCWERLRSSAPTPVAVFWIPDVLSFSASKPVAVFARPVWLEKSAW
jgi:hypothetical protein